jgi:hypothetical protein
MKITEETKIKDLIPEGYEIDENIPATNGIYISLKKKQENTFDWYVKKYFASTDDFFYAKKDVRKYISKDAESILIYDICEMNYDMPFEFKIGLLKFIYDDLGSELKFAAVIHEIQRLISNRSYVINSSVISLFKICPIAFLESALKN